MRMEHEKCSVMTVWMPKLSLLFLMVANSSCFHLCSPCQNWTPLERIVWRLHYGRLLRKCYHQDLCCWRHVLLWRPIKIPRLRIFMVVTTGLFGKKNKQQNWMWYSMRGDRNEQRRQSQLIFTFQTIVWPTDQRTWPHMEVWGRTEKQGIKEQRKETNNAGLQWKMSSGLPSMYNLY